MHIKNLPMQALASMQQATVLSLIASIHHPGAMFVQEQDPELQQVNGSQKT